MKTQTTRKQGRPRKAPTVPVGVRIECRLMGLWEELSDRRQQDKRSMLSGWITDAARKEILSNPEHENR